MEYQFRAAEPEDVDDIIGIQENIFWEGSPPMSFILPLIQREKRSV